MYAASRVLSILSVPEVKTTAIRHYVRGFWAKNNDYKGIQGHVRNPPKMYGYTLASRNLEKRIHRPSAIFELRHCSYDAMMKTPSGRIRMMKKYLEKSPFLACPN